MRMNLIAQPVANTDSPAAANSAASAAVMDRPIATSATGSMRPAAKNQNRQAVKISSVRVGAPSLSSALRYRRHAQNLITASTTSAIAIGLAALLRSGSNAV